MRHDLQHELMPRDIIVDYNTPENVQNTLYLCHCTVWSEHDISDKAIDDMLKWYESQGLAVIVTKDYKAIDVIPVTNDYYVPIFTDSVNGNLATSIIASKAARHYDKAHQVRLTNKPLIKNRAYLGTVGFSIIYRIVSSPYAKLHTDKLYEDVNRVLSYSNEFQLKTIDFTDREATLTLIPTNWTDAVKIAVNSFGLPTLNIRL